MLKTRSGEVVGTILRRAEVERATGLSRSTIYQRMKDGTFPKPVRLGAYSVGWLADEVGDWIAARINERKEVDHAGAS